MVALLIARVTAALDPSWIPPWVGLPPSIAFPTIETPAGNDPTAMPTPANVPEPVL
jgi:hypothetical protein